MGGARALGAALAAAVAAGGCDDSTHLKRAYRIPSPAMVPTLQVGDHVKADVEVYRHELPKRGDIVIFHPPLGAAQQRCGVLAEPANGRPCERPTAQTDDSVTFIKRIVALPGEWLRVVDNRVYIAKDRSGPFARQAEPFINPRTPCGELCNLRIPVRVPAGHYYMLGDNRGESDDSRDWGPAPREAMIGKVVDIEHR